jgi:hypothetical protein
MADLTSIMDLQPEQFELLEAAGYVDARHLVNVSAQVIHAELLKANRMLDIVEVAPGLEEVEAWVAQAKKGKGSRRSLLEEAEEEAENETANQESEDSGEELPDEPQPGQLVDYEADPDVQHMLTLAPLALPIPNRQLAERGIPPSEVSIAPVLNRTVGDLDIRVSARSKDKKGLPGAGTRPGSKSKSRGSIQVASYRGQTRRGIDSKRVRTMEEARSGVSAVEPLAHSIPADEDDRLRLLRTAREATNRGKDPESRSFIRGVLHDQSVMVWMGCLFMVIFQLTVPLALISAPLLILLDQQPETFHWVPKWLIAFPIALPIIGLPCLMVSCRVRCRVCGQKILLPRQCRKNVKAHHVRGLGYVFPLAIHTLIFRWFNCTFCGTSVRIKE